MVSVELDLDDVEPVALTKARALGLQAELYLRLSDPQFQGKLAALRAECDDDWDLFQKKRQDLLFVIQREVLPKYGYPASRQGVAALRKGLEEFADDPLIRASREVIGRSVSTGSLKSDSEEQQVQEEDWVALFRVPDSIPLVPKVSQRDVGLPHAPTMPLEPVNEAQPGVRRDVSGGGVPVELDLDDLEQVPLTRERALALQHELIEQFSSHQFQDRLKALEAQYPYGSGKFRTERMRLAMEVQSRVLPKYGYEGSLLGVSKMLHHLDEQFPTDKELHDNNKVVDLLLRGSGPRPPPTAHPPTGGADAAEEVTPQRRISRMHSFATEHDGFWEVVGGKKSGGLLVRLGDDLHSPAFHELLGTGAVIKEVTRSGDRLCYEKVSGVGPNYGWISMHLHEHDLLKRYVGEVPVLISH